MDITAHFVAQHGTVFLLLFVLAEQIGLPIPAIPVLIIAGALVGIGQMNFAMAVGASILAALLGDQVWFELGRRRGRRILTWLCRISLEPTACVRRTEEFFSRHGVHALVVAKFIPGLSTVAPALAGVMGLRMTQYFVYNGIGTVLWVGFGIGLGLLFSDRLDEARSLAAHLSPGIGLALLGSLTGYIIYKTWRRSRISRLVPRRTVRHVQDQIAAGEEPTFVDLRSESARKDIPGIPGSIALSVEDVTAKYHTLPRDRDVILYCACSGDTASVQAASSQRTTSDGDMQGYPTVPD
jgi:membrane protein DedA with SNARE-associated domain/rhodanese-related sulfurtransferase